MSVNVENALNNAHKVFFVGIGGVSMSSLAVMMRRLGYVVGGSDTAESTFTDMLTRSGIPVTFGHSAENVRGYDAVVYSGAIHADNPELKSARGNIPVISRAELLGYIMKPYRRRIGIAGSHGKSTTTALTAHIYARAGLDPAVMCGAEMPEFGAAYTLGEDTFIFEACEYRDSFLSFYPSTAVILNAELDHTDYFADEKAIERSFSEYARIPFDTSDDPRLIVCADDDGAMRATAGIARTTFGIGDGADIRAENIREKNGIVSFDISVNGTTAGTAMPRLVGHHNIYNVLAAFSATYSEGIPTDKIIDGINSFYGIARRFETKGTYRGARIIIDYAHHPTELQATIHTAANMCHRRLITVFEPHTYSRTAALFDKFITSFGEADVRFFTDIYSARETNDTGINPCDLAYAADGIYTPSYKEAAEAVRRTADDGDIILILGAGTIEHLAEMIGE